jgi:hypothetical protein
MGFIASSQANQREDIRMFREVLHQVLSSDDYRPSLHIRAMRNLDRPWKHW